MKFTPTALRWMIKRRGYAHSRWGREYRLTDSQVAAIQEDLARPARQAQAAARGARGPRTSKRPRNDQAPAQAGSPPERRRTRALPLGDAHQALAEQLASPPTVTAMPDSPAARRRES